MSGLAHRRGHRVMMGPLPGPVKMSQTLLPGPRPGCARFVAKRSRQGRADVTPPAHSLARSLPGFAADGVELDDLQRDL